MRRFLPLLILLASVAASAGPGVPVVEGPDLPTATDPVAVIDVFSNERFECTEHSITKQVAIPTGWNRAFIDVTITPDGDPWDRLFGASVGGVEVLRGTTPRTAMTVRREITEFAAVFPQGEDAPASLYLGSYVGALLGSVRLSFYADPLVVRTPASTAVGAFTWRRLNGNGSRIDSTVTFGPDAPTEAAVDVTMSGHGSEEFWFLSALPRAFHVLIDDVEVATIRSMPYVYALLGFGNANANTACVGPGTSSTGDRVHPVMWWTAQRGLDIAGVHTGTGEIPAFRAAIDDDARWLLSGTRTVSIVQEGGGATWLTSAAFVTR